MNVPWHLLIHTASIVPASYSVEAGASKPAYSSATSIPCRVQDENGIVLLDNQRLAGGWVATGYFPVSYAGSSVSIPKDCLISVTGPGFGSGRSFRVMGVPQNQAGMGVLFTVSLEATS